MKVITRGVIDWATLEVLEEDSYEYQGPVALAKDSGSPPQPVDPWEQAGAQYALSTGTAQYNAGLNRTNSVNPVGSSTWSSTTPSYSGGPSGGFGLGGGGAPTSGGSAPQAQPSSNAPASANSGYTPNPLSSAALTGQGPTPYATGPGGATIPMPGAPGSSAFNLGGPPTYTNTVQLAPQFQSALQQPIDTSQIPGMPGGPSLGQNVNSAEKAVFDSQMGLIAPQQELQREQLDSQLANQGITPGSAAYDYAKQEQGREQGFENSQVANNAVTTGLGELPMFYGLGSTSLQNQIAARNAPINEFEALQGAPGATSTALTPDISGAFGQQYQGALAGYNANVASNNNTTSTLGSLALAAAMFFSDRRLKEDIKQVGKTNEGLPVYTYRFKGDPRTQMGVMAQDVEKDKPEAVFSLGGRGGPKMVDYGAIR